ncbi:MAG: 16S rRNA (cytidine(1402)-2'-O)-methyltransferase [Bacteroidetes bacterium]|nr:MAG: 16S rRNA (cytidine(1402)-2'-O)-methyltransferase [Bacteroidota bacterium]
MSKLILVPTPVGNLKDITFRAVEILKEVDLILAEDTRTTSVLLKHFDIQNSMSAYHKFNEHKQVQNIIEKLQSGLSIALVSDAGTPGISDPGFLIVRDCLKNNIPVETLPGATAFVPALVNSGLPCDRFCFEGFLPQKKGRQKRLKELSEEKRTMVFYESPYRLIKTLQQFSDQFGEDRQVSVSRELTKIYEETVRGSLTEVISYFNSKTIKGEIVIILEGFVTKKTFD